MQTRIIKQNHNAVDKSNRM